MKEEFGIDNIRYIEDTWCEHCGQLEPYSPTIEDGFSEWCHWCALDDGDLFLSEEDKKIIKITTMRKQIEFHNNKADELTIALSKMMVHEEDGI